MRMSAQQAWKNFHLGEELGIAGTQIYNGLRRFHEMRNLDHTDEIFDFLYNLSIGLERLLKIAIILLEHNDDTDQKALEKSLITHNHLELLHRVKQHRDLKLFSLHNEFLALLGTFYKTHRHNRFLLSSVYDPDCEKKALHAFLTKHLGIDLQPPLDMMPIANERQYREFVRKIVIRISSSLYEIIKSKAADLNLYTYEVRIGSKSQTVFYGRGEIASEEVLWKELLIFFMNTKETSGLLEFLRSIEPLAFDPALANDYLQCFQSDEAKADVIGELEFYYEEMEGKTGDRLEMMDVIGDPRVISIRQKNLTIEVLAVT